jgi:predicted TIM-barrel fold metal-dependent hydrolase
MSSPNFLPIIDTHHHLWDLGANYYPWLTDRITTRVCGEYSAIRKNYLLRDFLKDAADVNLVKSIHVQAEHDHTDPLRETRWLQMVADSPGSMGFPHGIIAYADLSRSDVETIIEAHCRYPNVRGIRQMLHECMVDPLNSKRSLIENSSWRKNISLLKKYGLSFDLQVYPQQMVEARKLVKQNQDLQFILCHTGQPSKCDEDSLKTWRTGMRALAELQNVCVKISGLGMFNREWTVGTIRPFVLDAIEVFDVKRCMFGSNFPVDGMMSSYSRLWSAYNEITINFSDNERHALFCGNAERIFRI